jgi:choline kinase
MVRSRAVVVIILAAGTGSRLGPRTANLPKPAVVVGGHPLLAYDLAFARLAGATRIAVVTGHRREISEPLARAHGADVVLWNPRFARAGNLISLLVARDAGLLDGGFLLMNADHVYKPSIAEVIARVASTSTEITGFVDRDRSLGPDDMKARLDPSGHITAIAKTLDEHDVGYVGMTFVPAARAADYLRTCDEVLRDQGDSVHVEAVLARLATTQSPAATADISGHGWLEIDDEADLARAEQALANDPWYRLVTLRPSVP